MESVANYVEQDSPAAAAAIARAALDGARKIANFPEAGSIVPEFNDSTLREVTVKGRFRLMYRIKRDGYYVVAFLHHARDITRLARTREFDV